MVDAGLPVSVAQDLVEACLTAARAANAPPMAVAVVDAAGSLVCFKREDGAPPIRGRMAQGKAWSTVHTGRSTRSLAEIGTAQPQVIQALCDMADRKLVPLAGGVLLPKGLGGIGVSGDTADQDEAYALSAIKSLGL